MQHQICYSITIMVGDYEVTASFTENFIAETLQETTEPLHSHRCFEFHFILNGTARIMLDKEDLIIKEMDVCIIAPEVKHRIALVDRNATTSNLDFLLDIQFLSTHCKVNHRDVNHLMATFLDLQTCYIFTPTAIYYQIIEEIWLELSRQQKGYIDMTGILLSRLVLTWARDIYYEKEKKVINYPKQPEKNTIQIIEDYLTIQPNKIYSRKELAALLYISERQLERTMQKLYGKCFRDILLSERIETAHYYIQNTKMSLEEIGKIVGYSSSKTLHQAYKKYFGTTPSTARKKRFRSLSL